MHQFAMQSSAIQYTEEWFRQRSGRALRAAEVVVPIINKYAVADRIIDVGCGRGEWLSVFRQHGASIVVGVDGQYLEKNSLFISPDEFIPMDLSCPNLFTNDRFDLAISLEVAEHLPSESAERFVKFLTRMAPVVVFSAAIPDQPGTGHINCRWPNYWFHLFRNQGYVPCDPFRRHLWRHPEVPEYYQRNLFAFAAPDAVLKPELKEEMQFPPEEHLTLIEPGRIWRQPDPPPTVSARYALRLLKTALLSSAKRRVARMLRIQENC